MLLKFAGATAEQRVLGVLEGAPEWSEVMDMVSSQVYFWNSSTNEVAWEPPEGSNPRYYHPSYAPPPGTAPQMRRQGILLRAPAPGITITSGNPPPPFSPLFTHTSFCILRISWIF